MGGHFLKLWENLTMNNGTLNAVFSQLSSPLKSHIYIYKYMSNKAINDYFVSNLGSNLSLIFGLPIRRCL